MAGRKKRKASAGNRAGMIVVTLVVAVLITVLLTQSMHIRKKITSSSASNTQLQTMIQEEKDRAQDLERLPDYIESDEYIEKAAREKFGLVYEDEIIFKPAD